MSIMGKMVRIPAGNTTNEHYNFVVAKPIVFIKGIRANSAIVEYFLLLKDVTEI